MRWRGRFSSADIVAASDCVFVRSSLPGAVRVTEVDFHIRGHREGFVFGHLQPAIPGQRSAAGMLEACESDEGRTAFQYYHWESIVSNTEFGLSMALGNRIPVQLHRYDGRRFTIKLCKN
jgi:hypothetical protein